MLLVRTCCMWDVCACLRQFGKRLAQIVAVNPKLSSYYLDYKSLKQALKDIVAATAGGSEDGNPGDRGVPPACVEDEEAELADAEEHFVLALEGEFAKVESFFRRVLAEEQVSFRGLCKRASALACVDTAALRDRAEAVTTMQELLDLLEDFPEHQKIVEALLAFAEDVDDVRRFVMTNAQALVKICKKHDKCSAITIRQHYIEVLRRCTFYNSRAFGALIADTVVLARALIAKLTGRQCQAMYDFRCPICMHVLCNPLLLSCDHRFCNSCVTLSTFFGSHTCPVCRKECGHEEEHMRIDTLTACFDRLLRLSSSKSHRKGAARAAPSTSHRDPAPVPDLPATQEVETCALDTPCSKCVPRSPHMHVLLREMGGAGRDTCPGDRALSRSGSRNTLPRCSGSRDSLVGSEHEGSTTSQEGSLHTPVSHRKSSHTIIEQIMRENGRRAREETQSRGGGAGAERTPRWTPRQSAEGTVGGAAAGEREAGQEVGQPLEGAEKGAAAKGWAQQPRKDEARQLVFGSPAQSAGAEGAGAGLVAEGSEVVEAAKNPWDLIGSGSGSGSGDGSEDGVSDGGEEGREGGLACADIFGYMLSPDACDLRQSAWMCTRADTECECVHASAHRLTCVRPRVCAKKKTAPRGSSRRDSSCARTPRCNARLWRPKCGAAYTTCTRNSSVTAACARASWCSSSSSSP